MFRRTRIFPALIGFLVFGATLAHASQPNAKLAKLAKEKLEVARQAFKLAMEDLQTGRGTAEQIYLWSRRCLEAQRDLSAKKSDKLASLKEHLQRMKDLQKVTTELYRTGKATQFNAVASQFYVLEAEIWLSQTKTK